MIQHKKLRVFVLVLAVGIIGMVFASTPEEINQSALEQASNQFDLSEQEILENAEQQIFIQSFVNDQPDFIIDQVEYSIDEQQTPNVTVKTLDLTRTFTFDDGSTDVEEIDSSIVESVSLDFLAIKEDNRPLTNGKIKFDLEIPVTKDVSVSEGQFSIGLNDKVIKTIIVDLSQSDVVDGKLQIFTTDFQIKQILSNLPDGIHTLEIRLDKMFVVYDDFSREFSNPSQIVYSVELEKNSAKTIKKNEQGHFTKTFDFDVPITVSANSQSVKTSICLSSCKGGGCCSTHSATGYIPAPAMGSVTITDVSTGEVVASKDATNAGGCKTRDYRLSSITGNQNVCTTVIGGGGVGFNAQRGESYRIDVSDPKASWTIEVPESGGSFSYSCKTAVHKEATGYVYGNYGTSQISYNETTMRSCNF